MTFSRRTKYIIYFVSNNMSLCNKTICTLGCKYNIALPAGITGPEY